MGELRAGRLDELLAPIRRPFALTALSLALFYLGMAPWSAYPLKSFLYSTWLLFDLFAIWLTTQHLFREASPCFFKRVALAPLLFASAVILVDSVAYTFGHRGGLIGFNQDIFLNLAVSRPHAFSNEPSYAAGLPCRPREPWGPICSCERAIAGSARPPCWLSSSPSWPPRVAPAGPASESVSFSSPRSPCWPASGFPGKKAWPPPPLLPRSWGSSCW